MASSSESSNVVSISGDDVSVVEMEEKIAREAEVKRLQDEARRQERAHGLRQLADFIEDHEEAKPNEWDGHTFTIYASDQGELVRLAQAFGGKWDKEVTETFFSLRRDYGGGVKLDLTVWRSQLCAARTVETKKVVTKKDPAAVEAALANIPEIEVEEIETTTEWDCPPSVLALTREAPVPDDAA